MLIDVLGRDYYAGVDVRILEDRVLSYLDFMRVLDIDFDRLADLYEVLGDFLLGFVALH
ncbi:MAG: hypothetical protein NZM04_02695 [Methylacidiphilales bacterium]|nr:hypothetical protein [Candidatus Methylacidiphilales bacterium]MDW8348641.1 hypothetical protein [Verrucomicrobiae bacterium]